METYKRIAVVLFFLLSLSWGGASAWSWTQEEIVDKIQQHYREIKDLQADFHQETTLPMMNRVNEASGRLYLKIPGKMRWDYSVGQKKTVVIDGQTMWFYEPQERQVTVTDLDRLPNSRELLTFLTGMGEVKKEFRLNASEPSQETREGYVTVHLLPRSDTSQWTHLRLLVDPKNFQVVQTAFEGVQGDRTVIDYSNIRTDVGLSGDLFKFDIPDGVDVLHYPPREGGK
jgi:outer membrane lipoprotein carrier protein